MAGLYLPGSGVLPWSDVTAEGLDLIRRDAEAHIEKSDFRPMSEELWRANMEILAEKGCDRSTWYWALRIWSYRFRRPYDGSWPAGMSKPAGIKKTPLQRPDVEPGSIFSTPIDPSIKKSLKSILYPASRPRSGPSKKVVEVAIDNEIPPPVVEEQPFETPPPPEIEDIPW